MGESHKFRGKLLIPGADDQALVVDLRVQEGALLVTTGGESLGVWPVEQVFVERVAGERFNLTLDGEDTVFLADDALAFSYEAVPAIEQEASLLRDKRRLRRKRDKSVKRLLSTSAKHSEPAPSVKVEPAKSERAATPASVEPSADPFDGWLPEPQPAPRPRPRRAAAGSRTAERPPTTVRHEASKRAPIEVITSEPAEVAKAKAVEKKAAPAAKRLAPVEPTTIEVATEFRQRPRPQPKAEPLPAPEPEPARPAAQVPSALIELKAPPARSRSKKGAAARPPAPVAKPAEVSVPAVKPEVSVPATGPAVSVPEPAVARVAAPASRAWKKMATSASSAAARAGESSPTGESTSKPARLRKSAGSGFTRQMEAVDPAPEAVQETEATTGRRPWKRSISGGPLPVIPQEAPAEGTEMEIDLKSSLLPDQPDPFAAGDLVGTAPVATPYGIRSRPTGLSARLRRRQDVEPHDHRYVQQNVGAGLLRRVCEVCGHVSLDLTEEEAAEG